MGSLFTKIVKGEIPSHKIAETERCLAFMDIRPINPGHVLVIPKEEIDYFFDLPSELFTEVMLLAKKVAVAIKNVVPCKRIGVMVAGLEVPHAHVHLVPILESLSELSFANARPAEQNELEETAKAIRNAYMKLA